MCGFKHCRKSGRCFLQGVSPCPSMPTKEETKTAEMNFQYDGFLEPDRLLDVLGFAPKGQVSAKPAKKRKAAA
ncbi:MAG: hypothetical protein ABJF50_23940 [Paracoccaceae bacterium]